MMPTYKNETEYNTYSPEWYNAQPTSNYSIAAETAPGAGFVNNNNNEVEVSISGVSGRYQGWKQQQKTSFEQLGSSSTIDNSLASMMEELEMECRRTSPENLLNTLVKVAYEAVADAGMTRSELANAKRTGVFVGVVIDKKRLMLAQEKLATRLFMSMELGSGSYVKTVGLSTLSSLEALDAAIEAIKSGKIDQAIVLSVNGYPLFTDINEYDKKCVNNDELAVIFVTKSTSGYMSYGVVKQSKIWPKEKSWKLKEIYAAAGVEPSSVAYVETFVNDVGKPQLIETIVDAFATPAAKRTAPLVLGYPYQYSKKVGYFNSSGIVELAKLLKAFDSGVMDYFGKKVDTVMNGRFTGAVTTEIPFPEGLIGLFYTGSEDFIGHMLIKPYTGSAYVKVAPRGEYKFASKQIVKSVELLKKKLWSFLPMYPVEYSVYQDLSFIYNTTNLPFEKDFDLVLQSIYQGFWENFKKLTKPVVKILEVAPMFNIFFAAKMCKFFQTFPFELQFEYHYMPTSGENAAAIEECCYAFKKIFGFPIKFLKFEAIDKLIKQAGQSSSLYQNSSEYDMIIVSQSFSAYATSAADYYKYLPYWLKPSGFLLAHDFNKYTTGGSGDYGFARQQVELNAAYNALQAEFKWEKYMNKLEFTTVFDQSPLSAMSVHRKQQQRSSNECIESYNNASSYCRFAEYNNNKTSFKTFNNIFGSKSPETLPKKIMSFSHYKTISETNAMYKELADIFNAYKVIATGDESLSSYQGASQENYASYTQSTKTNGALLRNSYTKMPLKVQLKKLNASSCAEDKTPLVVIQPLEGSASLVNIWAKQQDSPVFGIEFTQEAMECESVAELAELYVQAIEQQFGASTPFRLFAYKFSMPIALEMFAKMSSMGSNRIMSLMFLDSTCSFEHLTNPEFGQKLQSRKYVDPVELEAFYNFASQYIPPASISKTCYLRWFAQFASFDLRVKFVVEQATKATGFESPAIEEAVRSYVKMFILLAKYKLMKDLGYSSKATIPTPRVYMVKYRASYDSQLTFGDYYEISHMCAPKWMDSERPSYTNDTETEPAQFSQYPMINLDA